MFLAKLNSSDEVIFPPSFSMLKGKQKTLGIDTKHKLLTRLSQDHMVYTSLDCTLSYVIIFSKGDD